MTTGSLPPTAIVNAFDAAGFSRRLVLSKLPGLLLVRQAGRQAGSQSVSRSLFRRAQTRSGGRSMDFRPQTTALDSTYGRLPSRLTYHWIRFLVPKRDNRDGDDDDDDDIIDCGRKISAVAHGRAFHASRKAPASDR